MRRDLSALIVASGLLVGSAALVDAQTVEDNDQVVPTDNDLVSQPVDPSPAIPPVQRGGPLARSQSPQSVIDLARANAATHTAVPQEQVSVLSVQPAEWPDFRLGCPSPSPRLQFAQVEIPGFIIELDAAGTPLTYHTDFGLRAVLCEPAGPGG